MVDDTIGKIRRRLDAAKNLSPERRRELTELLAQLEQEVGALSTERPDRAARLNAAARDSKDGENLDGVVSDLQSAVKEFEIEHPRLTQAINRIATTLSNLGI